MSDSNIKVLYIDDDLARVAGTAQQLQEADRGITIRHAAIVEDAAALLRNGDIDVVLFGLQNDGTGCDDLQGLHEDWPDTPIVATGAINDMALVKRSVACGARLFIPASLKAAKVCAIMRQQAQKQA